MQNHPALEELEARLTLSSVAHALPIRAPTILRATADSTDVPTPARRRDLVPTGRNQYWNLEPGFTAVFAGNEDGIHKRLTITVTPKTRVIDGVRTRIVFERQTANGHIEEIAENYFVIDRKTHDVYYFGEDVNLYSHGVLTSHESAWRSGVNGAKFGLVMPGEVSLGNQLQQERAPGVAEDHAEVVRTGLRAHVPVGTFRGAIQTRETSVLEPDA
ncbi:MAG: hypothetical protein JWN40_2175, partial [Phycisphaerales bacterium]|nr:hypothetical protein [Phycisphaerales bacterium]